MEMDRSEELEEQVRQLTQTVNEMRGRMARLEGKDRSEGNGHSPSSRRGFLKLGAGAALGAVGLAAAKVIPATAATGGTFMLGQANLAAAPTTLQGDTESTVGPPTQVLAAEAAGFVATTGTAAFAGPLQGLGGQGGTDPSTAVAADGVDGWAEGIQAFGVYGLTDAGVGVTGESSTGIGLYARSSGRILQDPRPAGKPTYTPNDFEQVRDANGAMWISGPGGIWTRPSLNSFPNPRRIWDGWFEPTAPGTYGPIDATQQVSTSGFTGGPSGIPVGAQAAYCAVQSYNAGYLTLYPDGTTQPGVTNWSGTVNGLLNMLFMLVPLSPQGKFNFNATFTGRKFIDAWGFLM
jgi:hypothetical protein